MRFYSLLCTLIKPIQKQKHNVVSYTDLPKNTSFHKQGTEAENVDVLTVSVTIIELQIEVGRQSSFLYVTKWKKNQF